MKKLLMSGRSKNLENILKTCSLACTGPADLTDG